MITSLRLNEQKKTPVFINQLDYFTNYFLKVNYSAKTFGNQELLFSLDSNSVHPFFYSTVYTKYIQYCCYTGAEK